MTQGKPKKDFHEDTEILYTKCRGPMLNKLIATIESAKLVYTKEVKQFITSQGIIRQSVGTGQIDPSIIKQRDVACKKAKASLEQTLAGVETEKFKNAIESILLLGKMISDKLKLEYPQSEATTFRAHFYPWSGSSADIEKSPEDALDVFLAMDTCAEVLEHMNKQALLKRNAIGLRTLVGELSCMIKERLPYWKSIISVIREAIAALGRVAPVDGLDGQLEKSMQRIHDGVAALSKAKIEQEIRDMRATHNARLESNWSAPKSQNSDVSRCASSLYNEQKNLFTSESKKWLVQRNYLPEMYQDLYASFVRVVDPLVRSMIGSSEFRSLKRYLTTRPLSQYERLFPLSPNLLCARFANKKCLLKRYPLTDPNAMKEMCKELALQTKLEEFVVQRASAVFFDNAVAYFHFDQATDIYRTVQDSKFSESAYHAILLIHHMIHVVVECHAAGVILGHIDPNSFVVDTNGLPHVHAFSHARIGAQSGAHKSTVGHMSPKHKSRLNDVMGEAQDVYALGKTMSTVYIAAQACIALAGAKEAVIALLTGMTEKNVAQRWTLKYALQKSDELCGTVQVEVDRVREAKEIIVEQQKNLDRKRQDVEFAIQLKQDTMRDMDCRKRKLGGMAYTMKKTERKMMPYASMLAARNQILVELTTPSYWSNDTSKPWNMHPIRKQTKLFQLFRRILHIDDPKSLNKGMDVKEKGDYSSLDLVGVWRVENVGLWEQYSGERHNMRELLLRSGVRARSLDLRENLQKCLEELPGWEDNYRDCNETYLVHGTGPMVILAIGSAGVNERFTNAALFGKGSYFAEDPAKTDQYVTGDSVLGAHPELHKWLFPTGGAFAFPEYPLRAYYIFLCRYLVGIPVRVKCVNAKTLEFENIDAPNHDIWANKDRRELGEIPSLSPPMRYHSLVAERGGAIVRFREFCQFHSLRVYPEYLICYTRK